MTLAGNSLRRQFLMGALAGTLVTILILAAGIAVVAHRGVRVDIEIEPLAAMVREQVTSEAQQSLPDMLTEMENRVPAMVAEQMTERMKSAASINLADFTLELPESATKVIQQQLESVVEEIVYECFGQFDTDLAAAQLGDQAYELVKTSIAAQASQATLQYRLFGRLPVPVTLNFR